MDQRQSFSVTNDFFSGFIATFIQLVFLIILVYLLISVLNFVRDKFINKETDTQKENIGDLLTILNKLFYVSGFGFIIANLIEFVATQGYRQNGNGIMSFRDEWDYLTFGIILIFVGIGFKSANKAIRTNKMP
jgi:hypothetical protein